MQRRLLAYIIVSTIFLFVMAVMRAKVGPPPDKDGKPDVVAEAGETDANDTDDPESEASNDDNPEIGAAEYGDDPVEDTNPEEEAIERPDSPAWHTLGTMAYDPTAPTKSDKLVVTFNSRGGSVERIELVERNPNGKYRYRRVDIRSGYLGYLAASSFVDRDGVKVNVVAPGTPAAIAGIQVGDVIIAARGKAVESAADFQMTLDKTKPGETLSLDLDRGGNTLTVKPVLTEHPLDLVRLSKHGGPDQVKGNLSRLSCLLTINKLNNNSLKQGQEELPGLPSLHRGIWDAKIINDADRKGIEFRFALTAAEASEASKASGPLEIVRRYTLASEGSGYDLDLETEIINKSTKPQDVSYRLEGCNGVTMEGWWYATKISPNWTGGAGARDIVFNTVEEFHELKGLPALYKHANERKDDPSKDPNQTLFVKNPNDPKSSQLRYVAVDAQYFTTAYLPVAGNPDTNAFARGGTKLLTDVRVINRSQIYGANVTFTVDSVKHRIAGGESHKDTIRLFAGPKRPELLEQRGLDALIEYGMFGWISRGLSKILHGLFSIIGNYGIAIILLTFIVRGLMFPLSRKAAINAQKMQELAPEFKKIAEKHKDDMQARLEAQQTLQKKHGFNPLSGCLPMFVQLPIFMGLYRSLSCDIELRQAAFIPGVQWCSNLAAPDMLVDWSPWMIEYVAGRGTGWFGPYFNILPILVMGLFIAQQKMFMPPPTDEQQEITQKVMFFMTFVMGLFFFKVAAGLCVYFITSSLWGMAERVLVKKTIPPSTAGVDSDSGSGDGAGSGKLTSTPPKKDRPKKPPKKKR